MQKQAGGSRIRNRWKPKLTGQAPSRIGHGIAEKTLACMDSYVQLCYLIFLRVVHVHQASTLRLTTSLQHTTLCSRPYHTPQKPVGR